MEMTQEQAEEMAAEIQNEVAKRLGRQGLAYDADLEEMWGRRRNEAELQRNESHIYYLTGFCRRILSLDASQQISRQTLTDLQNEIRAYLG